ncbi:MAG: urate hydroxylase PuuD, partial [Pseudomonadota bacterium]
WLIAGLVFLMGVTIRHYFNTMHARQGRPDWTWAVTTILFIAIMGLSTAPMISGTERDEARALTNGEARFVQAAGFDEAYDIVIGRCSMCHAAEPVWDGMRWPPKGVVLETEADMARQARQILLHAGVSSAMPPANITWMEPEERAAIVAWYKAAVSGDGAL